MCFPVRQISFRSVWVENYCEIWYHIYRASHTRPSSQSFWICGFKWIFDIACSQTITSYYKLLHIGLTLHHALVSKVARYANCYKSETAEYFHIGQFGRNIEFFITFHLLHYLLQLINYVEIYLNLPKKWVFPPRNCDLRYLDCFVFLHIS